MRLKAMVALTATLLTGCGTQTDKNPQSQASKEVAAKTSTRNCGAASITFVEQTERTLPSELKPGGAALGRLVTAVDTAWTAACDKGVIPVGGLKENGKPLTAFKVFNNPNANTAGIYPEGGYAILEAPMYGGGQSDVEIPQSGEIEEAIYCFENGPPEGNNPQGRCLFD
jgi:hypothetical protein